MQNSQKVHRIFEDRTAALGAAKPRSGAVWVTPRHPENAVIDRKDDRTFVKDDEKFSREFQVEIP